MLRPLWRPYVEHLRSGSWLPFLSQPFFVAEQFTGMKGRYVKVADTVRSFKEIIEGKHDEIGEEFFYMKGAIEEVMEAAEKAKAGAAA